MTDADGVLSEGSLSEGLLSEGLLPAGLVGRLLLVGEERVDEVSFSAAGSVSVRARAWPHRGRPNGARPDGLVDVGGRLLLLRHGEVAEELGPDLRSLGRVDLAGRGRAVEPHPTFDRATGELHLLASPGEPIAAHQVISRGALVRRIRPLGDMPAPVRRLAVTRDRLVLFAHGATGIGRLGTADPGSVHWSATPTVGTDDLVGVDDAHDGSVAVLVVGSAVERWRLDPGGGSLRREVLLAAPPLPGRTTGDLALVPDRCTTADAFRGWLVGVVDDVADGRSNLLVLDLADLAQGPVATVVLPGPMLAAHRALWLG